MQLEKMLKMNTLFSFYGELLTFRQQEFMRDYYENDLTLQEIAENNNISRQAVSDSIRKAEEALEGFENKLEVIQEANKRKLRLENLKKYIENNYEEDQELNRLIQELLQSKNLTEGSND